MRDGRRLSARELMRLHVEALFTRDPAGRLVASNEPGGGPAPRLFLGRTAEGDAMWLRHDVDPGTARELQALCASLRGQGGPGADLRLPDPAPFAEVLSRSAALRKTWAGPAFHFPEDGGSGDDPAVVRVTPENGSVLSPLLEGWREDLASGPPMTAVIVDGRAVSLCCSVRVTEAADEAGVETHPDFRRRGYGARAVAAWAKAVRSQNRIPLYSTSWDNDASLALARTLKLLRFGVDLHLS